MKQKQGQTYLHQTCGSFRLQTIIFDHTYEIALRSSSLYSSYNNYDDTYIFSFTMNNKRHAIFWNENLSLTSRRVIKSKTFVGLSSTNIRYTLNNNIITTITLMQTARWITFSLPLSFTIRFVEASSITRMYLLIAHIQRFLRSSLRKGCA